jgi:hypothetical protein
MNPTHAPEQDNIEQPFLNGCRKLTFSLIFIRRREFVLFIKYIRPKTIQLQSIDRTTRGV